MTQVNAWIRKDELYINSGGWSVNLFSAVAKMYKKLKETHGITGKVNLLLITHCKLGLHSINIVNHF